MSERAQAPQPKVTTSEKRVKKRVKKANDFSHEYAGKMVKVTLSNNNAIIGTLVEASKYWFKLQVGIKTVYVNKAWVVKVELP